MTPVREVAFELEAFEWSEDRLDVAGRWVGLTGRRLAKPVLTVQLDSGRRKRVVAMPGGQLGTPGERWSAAFNWPGDPGEIIGVELEVGRNVVVELPLPDRKRKRRRRAPSGQSVTEELRLETGALRAQADRLRAELAARERELESLRAQLAERPVEERSTVELESAALAAAADVDGLHAEHEAERARWREEIDALRQAIADAAQEAEQANRRHAAELAAVRTSAPAPPPATAAFTPVDVPAPEPEDERAALAADAAPAVQARPGGEPAANGSGPGRAGLVALRERLTTMFAQPERDAEPPALRPRRSAAPARARAGATVAARRSEAEVWALRILAALVVAVLLIAFVALITSLG